MRLALKEANLAQQKDEVPVGAVIVDSNGDIIAKAHNESILSKDPTAHAEIVAIRRACERKGAQRIPDCTLYVTLEPCTMCAGAISFARISRLVFGAYDKKGGAVESGVEFFNAKTCHHKPYEITSGILEKECREVLQTFFRLRR